jgi:hypothetical protein
MELKLWHGCEPRRIDWRSASVWSRSPLALPCFCVCVTGLRHISVCGGAHRPARPGADLRLWLFSGLLTLAEWVTRQTQTGSLRQYVRVVLLALVITCLYPLVRCFPALERSLPVGIGARSCLCC